MDLDVKRYEVIERMAVTADTISLLEMEGEDLDGGSMGPVIREFFQRIRQTGLKDDEIAEQIGEMVKKPGGYTGKNISQWRRGGGMPPADALLAVAQVTRLSLDELLFGKSELRLLAQEVAELQQSGRERDARLKRLESLLGQPIEPGATRLVAEVRLPSGEDLPELE